MNTGFLGPAVATVLTACGIETHKLWMVKCLYKQCCNSTYRLRYWNKSTTSTGMFLYICCNSTYRLRYWNLSSNTDLIEIIFKSCNSTYRLRYWNVTLLKTMNCFYNSCNSTYRLRYWNIKIPTSNKPFLPLQQYLPLAVLKLHAVVQSLKFKLQQYLPLAVLKLSLGFVQPCDVFLGCNSTYRLRYWNSMFFNCSLLNFFVATVLTACGIETVNPNTIFWRVLTLQQYLPLAVLKPIRANIPSKFIMVATVLTACGIETSQVH